MQFLTTMFIRASLAYGAIYGSSAERTAALPGWLDQCNFRRRHGSLGHHRPRLGSPSWNNVLGNYI